MNSHLNFNINIFNIIKYMYIIIVYWIKIIVKF